MPQLKEILDPGLDKQDGGGRRSFPRFVLWTPGPGYCDCRRGQRAATNNYRGPFRLGYRDFMETSENRAQGGPSADGGSRSPHLWPAGPSALLRPPYIPTQVLQPLGGLLPSHSSLSSALPMPHGCRGLSCHAVAERRWEGTGG